MAVNPITGTSRIVFLGAGASKPFGKMLMGEFVPWSKRKGNGGPIRSILSASRSELLDALCDKNEDLEFLIDELGSLCSKDYLIKRTRTIHPMADSLGPGMASEESTFPRILQTGRGGEVVARRPQKRGVRALPQHRGIIEADRTGEDHRNG